MGSEQNLSKERRMYVEVGRPMDRGQFSSVLPSVEFFPCLGEERGLHRGDVARPGCDCLRRSSWQ